MTAFVGGCFRADLLAVATDDSAPGAADDLAQGVCACVCEVCVCVCVCEREGRYIYRYVYEYKIYHDI